MQNNKKFETISALDLMTEECELLEHRIENAELSRDPKEQEQLPKLKHALEYFVQRILDEMGAYDDANIPTRWQNQNKTLH